MESNKEQILMECGLSKNEAKVYLALLELGLTTIHEISKTAGLHRTNVYDSLNKLIEKGFITHVTKEEKRYYEATDPHCLIGLLKEKEEHLQTILPQLTLSNKLAPSRGEAKIYEGIVAVKNILNHFLELKKPRYIYGVPKVASDMLSSFLVHYHKRRVEAKLEMKHIYNSDAKDRIHYLNSLPYTESRYLSKEYDSPVATSICGDEVVLTLYIKRPLTIQIKNAEIARAYKGYFDLLWSIAKKE